jgi:hypothetical protein
VVVDYARVGQRSNLHGADTYHLLAFRASQTLKISDNVTLRGHARTVGVTPGPGLLTLRELGVLFDRLIGAKLRNPGATQERLRGQALHEAVCEVLGYDRYADTGQHPDIPNQLLELKLQTSPTIDLGLVDPASEEPLPPPFPQSLRICDVRYAVFGATHTDTDTTQINSVHLTSGANFHNAFVRMGGRGQNSKLQIRLPREWFE